jgi:hypothetical protein
MPITIDVTINTTVVARVLRAKGENHVTRVSSLRLPSGCRVDS